MNGPEAVLRDDALNVWQMELIALGSSVDGAIGEEGGGADDDAAVLSSGVFLCSCSHLCFLWRRRRWTCP